MKLQKYPPFYITIFLILGILSGFYMKIPTSWVLPASIVGIFVLLLMYFNTKKRLQPSILYALVSFVVFYLIGILCMTMRLDKNDKSHYTNLMAQEEQQLTLTINTILKSNAYFNKYEADLTQIDGLNCKGKILLSIKKDSLSQLLDVDDKLIVRSNLLDISSPKNPNQFDYKHYLEKKNMYKQLTISSDEFVLINNNNISLKGLAHQFRKKVMQSLEKNGFEGDELAIINSLLLGQRQEISQELLDDYSKAGAIHILAISGLHIGIILLFLNFLFKPLEFLKNGKIIKLIVIILVLWVFAFVAGLSASVVRAVTMFSAIAISLWSHRQRNVYHALIFSAFILLVVYPFYLFDVGFQLSYLAVFFIVWIQPTLQKLWSPKYKLVNYFWQLFTVSLAAQLGVLPLSLYYFHQFPGLFFITNLVIIPVLGFILGLGIVVILLSLLNSLPKVLVLFYETIISSMNGFIAWIAQQESFLFKNIAFSLVLMMVSYLFLIMFFSWVQKRSFQKLMLVLSAFILLQSVFFYEKWKMASSNEIIVFNQNRHTLIAERKGQNVHFYASDSVASKNSINNYLQAGFLKKDDSKTLITPTLLLHKNIFIIDSTGIYNIPDFHPEKVILINSPKINLARLISFLQPKMIIADNSNYKSYVINWQKTCIKNKIPFYYTNKSGAFSVTY